MAEQHATGDLIRYTDADKPGVLRVADRIRSIVDYMGRLGSWFFVPLVLITCFDVIIRKAQLRDDGGQLVFGIQDFLVRNISPYFGSTMLQELQWHFHTALFAFALAYGIVWNTHVRVDLVRETLSFRRKAWIELIGTTVFLIPFVSILLYFAIDYAYTSWAQGEISASTVGLSHRWIIKSTLAVGLVLVLLAGIAVWIQAWMALFDDPNRRHDMMTLEWPEEEGTMIEGKKRIELDDTEPTLPVPTADKEKTS